MTKTTYRELNLFWGAAEAWLTRKKEDIADPKTKLGYALRRMQNRVQERFREYNIRREDIDLDHAAVDKENLVMLEPTGSFEKYKASVEKRKERNKAWDDLMNRTVIEIEPYYATDIPSDLTLDEQECFAGFVIPKAEAMAAGSDG